MTNVRRGLSEEVLKALAEFGPQTSTQLAERLGNNLFAWDITTICSSLRKDGKVIVANVAKGRQNVWGLPEPGKELRITRPFEPRKITELWAWIVDEENGGEGVAACEMHIGGQPMMMVLIGADEERVRSLEPQARLVEQRMGLKVSLRRFKEQADG